MVNAALNDCGHAWASGRASDFIGERSVGERFGKMDSANILGRIEIGKRARNAQDAVIATRGQAH
jgi:hypothetical protein